MIELSMLHFILEEIKEVYFTFNFTIELHLVGEKKPTPPTKCAKCVRRSGSLSANHFAIVFA